MKTSLFHSDSQWRRTHSLLSPWTSSSLLSLSLLICLLPGVPSLTSHLLLLRIHTHLFPFSRPQPKLGKLPLPRPVRAFLRLLPRILLHKLVPWTTFPLTLSPSVFFPRPLLQALSHPQLLNHHFLGRFPSTTPLGSLAANLNLIKLFFF